MLALLTKLLIMDIEIIDNLDEALQILSEIPMRQYDEDELIETQTTDKNCQIQTEKQ